MDVVEANPLYLACKEGHAAIVKLLLSIPSIDVNQRSRRNRFNRWDEYHHQKQLMFSVNPLFAACKSGHTDVVKLLLSIPSIDVNGGVEYYRKFESKKNSNPLYAACQKGHTQIVALLITHKSLDVNKHGVYILFIMSILVF